MATKEIVLIADPRVLAIPVEEVDDHLVQLSEFEEFAIDQRKAQASHLFSLVRRSVANRLIHASTYLPDAHRFLIVEGYRPLSLQRRYFENYFKKLSALHPEWDTPKTLDETSKFVAPPESIPPHSTGAAVDLTIVDESGNELDMGTVLNADPVQSCNACFTAADNISDVAKHNREVLIRALTEAGFTNYATEWWHWSYGDRYWAYMTGQRCAMFGSLDL